MTADRRRNKKTYIQIINTSFSLLRTVTSDRPLPAEPFKRKTRCSAMIPYLWLAPDRSPQLVT